MKRMIPTALLGLTMLLTGCAGGWRDGAPPGAAGGAPPAAVTAPAAITAPAVVTAPASKAAPGAQATSAVTAASSEGVTFVWKGEGESVALAGDFNAWSTTADPLKKQPDSSWTITKRIEPGRYNYKFALDGGKVWKEDPNSAEFSADPYGGKNSVLVVGGAAAAPAAPASPTPPAATTVPAGVAPRVSDGGVTFVWKGEGATVALAGEFNGWNTTADPMTKQADSSWTITKKLEPGRYLYKFVLDGGKVWKDDPGASEFEDDGHSGRNSVLVVGGGASPAAASVSPAASAAPAGKGKAPVQTPDGVVFTFAGTATSVALAGDFNAWAMNADPLAKQADGSWTLTKKLAAGTYEYKFVVDGTTWKTDEANPESKADPYGGKNSLVTVK